MSSIGDIAAATFRRPPKLLALRFVFAMAAAIGLGALLVPERAEANPFCPLTQGFWKNHPNVWPKTVVTSGLTLGSASYTQAELLTILNTPSTGDASLILAKQLIAAKLNFLSNTVEVPALTAAITDADSLLSGFSGKLPYHVAPSSTTGQLMVSDATVLDIYNNGQLTPICRPLFP
jgi:hypothetical protein